MLPTKLGMASLRQTRKLRLNTANQRQLRLGGLKRPGGLPGAVIGNVVLAVMHLP